MTDTIASRVTRVIGGSVHALLDAVENASPEATMAQAIREVDQATGNIITVAGNGPAEYSGDGGASISAQLNSPGGMAVDASGDFFIADTGSNCIRKVG